MKKEKNLRGNGEEKRSEDDEPTVEKGERAPSTFNKARKRTPERAYFKAEETLMS